MKWYWILLILIIVFIIIASVYKYNNKNEINVIDIELPDEIIIEGCGEDKSGSIHYKKEDDKYVSLYNRKAGPMKELISEETYIRGYDKYLKYKEDPEKYCKSLIK